MTSPNLIGKVGVRRKAPKRVLVEILRRDHWLCHWCGFPVIFAPAMKYVEKLAKQSGVPGPLAYHDANWTRRNAPLLDHMGAVIDHVEAHSRGGPADLSNLVASCNKCNLDKSNASAKDFQERKPFRPVKGKYGEPVDWDGLSSLFIMLVEKTPQSATKTEREWLRALTSSAPVSK